MKTRRRLLSAAAASGLFLAALGAALPAGAQTVPSAYADLYADLQGKLDAFEATLDAQAPSSPSPVVYAAELLAANCNRGEALLQPTTLSVVSLSLDRFQALGIRGVTVAIHYPLFDPGFPRRDEYIAFYREMAREVRSRGMTLDVESHVVFTGTVFSPITWDWSGYTVESLAAARGAMAQVILDEVHPDYLNLGTESDTEASLTGLQSLRDPQAYAAFIAQIAAGLNKRNTKLGAGMGAWDDLAQGQALAQDPNLDVLTLHVYPLDPASQQNALALGQVAAESGKGLVLDEAWLYKARPGEPGGVAMAPEIFKRDAYSFWEPLDAQFLRCMAKLARVGNMQFVSVYWSNYLFAVLDYSPALDALPFQQVYQLATQAGWQALQAGSTSPTGDAYAALIAQSPATLSVDFGFSPADPTDASPVTFTAYASGGTPPYAFDWSVDGEPARGSTVSLTLGAGDHAVAVTVTDAAERVATRERTMTVAASLGIALVAKKQNPLRLKVSGFGFQPGCAVLLDGAAVTTTFKSGGAVLAKGPGLKALLPKGVVVQVVVCNPSGPCSAPFPYTR